MSIRDYYINVLNSNILENIRINPNQFNDTKNRPFGWFFNSVLFVGRTNCLEEHPAGMLGLVSAVGGPSASRGKKPSPLCINFIQLRGLGILVLKDNLTENVNINIHPSSDCARGPLFPFPEALP